MATSAEGVDNPTFCRLGWLVTRLHQEASGDAARLAALYGATFGGSRLAALWNAEDNVVARALRKPAAELDAVDARAYACMGACFYGPMSAYGMDAPASAAGLGTVEILSLWVTADPVISLPEDARPCKMLLLILDLLRAEQPPDAMEAVGLWGAVRNCVNRRPAVAQKALECGVFDLIMSSVKQSGAEWLTISSGRSGLAGGALDAAGFVIKGFIGQTERPDKEAAVSSGLFDACLAAAQLVEDRGAEGLGDTHYMAVYQIFAKLRDLSDRPECRAKLREIGSTLTFALAHDVCWAEEMGMSSSVVTANLCASVFGRDDDESEFVFTQDHVDAMCVPLYHSPALLLVLTRSLHVGWCVGRTICRALELA